MFTGIIQTLGKVEMAVAPRLRIAPLSPITDYRAGESIAINGACLTIEKFNSEANNNWFEVFFSDVTRAVTNLDKLRPNNLVNLERALQVGDRLGGHFVSGHVDTLAKVKNIRKQNESYQITLTFKPEFAKFLVEKGSITLDGVSLTLSKCAGNSCLVNIIPATFASTNIKFWQIGYEANMETDLLGKYVVEACNGPKLSKFDLQQSHYGM